MIKSPCDLAFGPSSDSGVALFCETEEPEFRELVEPVAKPLKAMA